MFFCRKTVSFVSTAPISYSSTNITFAFEGFVEAIIFYQQIPDSVAAVGLAVSLGYLGSLASSSLSQYSSEPF